MHKYDVILSRKLEVLFPNKSARQQVNILLGSYGMEACEKEPDRVRMAVLKLSGSDLDKMRHYTQRAKQDYRDILAWAEYPRQCNHWSLADGPEKAELRKEDLVEYDDWLKT